VPADIVILDCPWMNTDHDDDSATKWYSRCKQLNLYLADKPVATVVDDLFSHTDTRVVVVKAPKNFDLQSFVKHVCKNNNLLIKVCRIHSYFALILTLDS
jgi:hypothetical protein